MTNGFRGRLRADLDIVATGPPREPPHSTIPDQVPASQEDGSITGESNSTPSALPAIVSEDMNCLEATGSRKRQDDVREGGERQDVGRDNTTPMVCGGAWMVFFPRV